MDSLVGYGSDDEIETERRGNHPTVGGGAGGYRRRDDDDNYEEVNMDLSEDSQGGESEPELPQTGSSSKQTSRVDRLGSEESREPRRQCGRERRERDERRERQQESPVRSRADRERSDRRSPRHDDRHRYDRNDRGRGGFETGPGRRGLLGDKPEDGKVPALMDLKPFGGEPPPAFEQRRSHDARDAVSPRFVDRDRRDRDRDRERDRDRHNRRSEERRSAGHRHPERRERSRSRGVAYPPSGTHSSSSNERRVSPQPLGEYRPSSYKVNKKLEVMEKMGLQIKTPDGSMATAQQLRAAAGEPGPPGSALPSYYNPTGLNSNKIIDQKRKLLWSNKNKSEVEEAAKWSGTRFAQDSDGKQASKFMRLMGIKEPAAVKTETVDNTVDPIKKQEELFEAMQAQYEVARATTHTMRGVGLGFQRGQF